MSQLHWKWGSNIFHTSPGFFSVLPQTEQLSQQHVLNNKPNNQSWLTDCGPGGDSKPSLECLDGAVSPLSRLTLAMCNKLGKVAI